MNFQDYYNPGQQPQFAALLLCFITKKEKEVKMFTNFDIKNTKFDTDTIERFSQYDYFAIYMTGILTRLLVQPF